MKRSLMLFCLLVVQVVGLALFLKGFFPMKKAIPGSASIADYPPEPGSTEQGYRVPAVFDKLVIVLIDALRADFIFNDTRMAYTRKLIDSNNSWSFVAKAHSPTVTMPRIKAMMTGGVPSFIDAVFNSVSTALQQDNLPRQLVSANKKIVLFGDDTWLKLFPSHFLRSDGTTSFFVTDYTVVDNNVTRHVDKELQNTDWDVMVLHYLGLDHIGHLAGPSSPLVGPKLQEMDLIVQKIHKSLVKGDSELGTKSLLMLCGDHGMSDSGSHGGASVPEVLTPLVFFSSQFQNGKGSKFTNVMVDQIDIVSTLAILLGLPIPQNSVGHIIPELLTLHNPRDMLRALQMNSHQLYKVLEANGHQTGLNFELKEAHNLHKQWLESLKSGKEDQFTLSVKFDRVVKQYLKPLQDMSDEIAASLSCYDLFAMASGIAILVQVLGWLVCKVLRHPSSRNMSVVDNDSPIFLFTFCGCFMAMVGVHFAICSSTLNSGTCSNEILCSWRSSSLFFSLVLIVFSSLSISTLIINSINMQSLASGIILQTFLVFCCPVKSFLVAGSILHVFSLLSSSFVEEEHQTWYFLIKTYLIIALCLLIRRYFMTRNHKKENTEASRGSEFSEKNSEKHEKCFKITSENQFHINGLKNIKPTKDSSEEKSDRNILSSEKMDTQNGGREMVLSSIALLSCLVLVRVARAWNQTGIKWANLPDVGDWLMLADNIFILSSISFLSLFAIVVYTFKHCDFITTVLQSLGLLCVYHYRVATGVVWSPWIRGQVVTQGLTEARLSYFFSLALIILSIFRLSKALKNRRAAGDNCRQFIVYRRDIETAIQTFLAGCIVVVALVTRAHNFFLIAVFVVQHWCYSKFLSLSNTKGISWTTFLVYFWFGQVAYFTLGQSNSLSTVDMAAGYIGVQSHYDVVTFWLLVLSTYCGPLLWMTSLVQLTVKHSTSQKQLYGSLYDLCVTYILPQSIILCVYTALVYGQRYHLFVWSVFSPKLLYDTMKTAVTLVCVTIVLITSELIG